jgi:prevent-host-death family protein
MIRTISKTKLKAKLLESLHEVESSGEELIVTHRGKPVLKIVPIRRQSTVEEMFGHLQGRVTYLEDINNPTLTEWEGE